MGKAVTEALRAAVAADAPGLRICVDDKGVRIAKDCRVALYCFKRERKRLRRAEALKFDVLRSLYETMEKYGALRPTEVARVIAHFQLLEGERPVGDPVTATALVVRWARQMDVDEIESVKLAVKAAGLQPESRPMPLKIEVFIPLETSQLETLLKRARKMRRVGDTAPRTEDTT